MAGPFFIPFVVYLVAPWKAAAAKHTADSRAGSTRGLQVSPDGPLASSVRSHAPTGSLASLRCGRAGVRTRRGGPQRACRGLRPGLTAFSLSWVKWCSWEMAARKGWVNRQKLASPYRLGFIMENLNMEEAKEGTVL